MPIVKSHKKNQTYETLIKLEKDNCQMLFKEEEGIPIESADADDGSSFEDGMGRVLKQDSWSAE